MIKKFVIPISLIICGCTITSVLADNTLSDEECAQRSREYDDRVQMQKAGKVMAGTCQIGSDSICTRTDQIEMQQLQDQTESEIARLKDELITYCPSYAQGLE